MEDCGPCPVFASFALAFALQLRRKHGKTSVRVRKTSVTVQYTYYQKHLHITKPSQTHTLQNPHIQTLQNNIKYIYHCCYDLLLCRRRSRGKSIQKDKSLDIWLSCSYELHRGDCNPSSPLQTLLLLVSNE